MANIIEKQILTTVHLSDSQRMVMAKIVASATPQVAYESTSTSRNMVAARSLLVKLGLVSIDNMTATITPAGQEVLSDEALTDESGGLTDIGSTYAEAENLMDLHSKKKDQGTIATPQAQPQSPTPTPPQPDAALESFSLLQQIDQKVRRINH